MRGMILAVCLAGCSSTVGDGESTGGEANDGGGGAGGGSTTGGLGGMSPSMDCADYADAESCEAAELDNDRCSWVELFTTAQTGCDMGTPMGTCTIRSTLGTGLNNCPFCPAVTDGIYFYRLTDAGEVELFKDPSCSTNLEYTTYGWSACGNGEQPEICDCLCHPE